MLLCVLLNIWINNVWTNELQKQRWISHRKSQNKTKAKDHKKKMIQVVPGERGRGLEAASIFSGEFGGALNHSQSDRSNIRCLWGKLMELCSRSLRMSHIDIYIDYLTNNIEKNSMKCGDVRKMWRQREDSSIKWWKRKLHWLAKSLCIKLHKD